MTGVRQGFYRSSGHDSSMPGKWLPFDEIAGGWLNKTEYVQIPKGDLLGLHRYGTQGMKQISNALDDLQLPRGQKVELGADSTGFSTASTRASPLRPSSGPAPKGSKPAYAVRAHPARMRRRLGWAVRDQAETSGGGAYRVRATRAESMWATMCPASRPTPPTSAELSE